jgi:hypothetical protein
MINIVSQSATEIGIDGEIENVRLVQVDESAIATTVIANIVALCRLLNLTHALYRLASHCCHFLCRRGLHFSGRCLPQAHSTVMGYLINGAQLHLRSTPSNV